MTTTQLNALKALASGGRIIVCPEVNDGKRHQYVSTAWGDTIDIHGRTVDGLIQRRMIHEVPRDESERHIKVFEISESGHEFLKVDGG